MSGSDSVQTASQLRVDLRHQRLEVQKMKDEFAETGNTDLYRVCVQVEEWLKNSIKYLESVSAEAVEQGGV